MARLRRSRYLACFYCGQRTPTVYDGRLRHFECPSCNATNYLDKNGDITDPPASKTTAAETTTPYFASSPEPFHDGFGSPGSTGSNGVGSSSSDVFCKTCLKNQHLFISSLAQYFPSDPNHPDTPELERQYFRFRQGLEQRYPQVCADCEPRVLERIRQAGYTAKTDHLRRMVDYSRQVRLTRSTSLDMVNWLGRWLWWSGLVLQILWQAGVLGSFLLRVSANGNNISADDIGFGSDTIIDDSSAANDHYPLRPSGAATTAAVPVVLQPLLRLLVLNTDRLQLLCVGVTLASCWWNPYLVQTVRGFTKHLIGIPTWYGHQASIILARFLLAKVAGRASPTSSIESATALPPTIAGLHAVAALFILYLYAVAPRAIRKDVRPLFGKLPDTPLTPQRPLKTADRPSEGRGRGLETMSDVLDEISATPQHTASSPLGRRDSDTDGWDGWQPSQNGFSRSPSQHTAGGYTGSWQAGRGSDFGSLNISAYEPNTPASQPPLTLSQEMDKHYTDEMDWTPTQPSSQPPTQSPHRAFNTYDPRTDQFSQRPPSSTAAFSQTPVEAERGPFWYKVPPAPTSIAQRIFNRPNAPRLVQQAGLDDGGRGSANAAAFFNRDDDGQRRTLNLDSRGLAGASSSVEFAQPSFFAEDIQRKSKKGGRGGGDDDPGSFLSDLFSQTFTLGTGGGGREEEDEAYSMSGSHPVLGSAEARRRRASSHGRMLPVTVGSSFLRRAPSLLVAIASLAGVYFLREGIHDPNDNADLFSYVQPYALLIEGSSVGLCVVFAISLTSESVQRWNRANLLLQRQIERRAREGGRSPAPGAALWSSVLGILLGLASLAMAGWMSTQMWIVLQPGSAGQQQLQSQQEHASYESVEGEAYGWPDSQQQLATTTASPVLPWRWWQLAWLHGAVIAHQVWNMLVQ